jgi:ribosome-associated protein
VTDYFVIATGTSEPHLRAIENELLRGLLDDLGLKPNQSEGSAQSNWIVVDYFDVIVHLMKPDVREHYDLEGLWADAAQVKPPAPRKKAVRKTDEV